MSTPGKDNLSDAQRKKQNSENQKASAVGNKPVESASAKTEEPQLRSVNETPQYVAPQYVAPKPQTNSQAQLLSNEQIAANRQEYKRQAVQQAKQQGATLPITGTQSQANPTKVVVKKKTTKDVNPYMFTSEPYNAEDAEKRMSEDNWLKRLKKDYDDANEDARLKAEDSSRQAKGAAWGNLFSALGQLAGVGKNTYVAPDNKYLTNALSKADKAREFYDAIKESNRKNLLAAQNAWLEADRKSHADNQENMLKFYENLNNNLYKDAQNNSVETTEEYDDLAEEKIEIDRKRADAAETQANAANIRATAYSSGKGTDDDKDWFTPEFDGVKYTSDKKTAGKFADLMEEIAGESNDFNFDEDTISSNLSEKVKFDRLVRKFLKTYGSDERVKDFMLKLKKSV